MDDSEIQVVVEKLHDKRAWELRMLNIWLKENTARVKARRAEAKAQAEAVKVVQAQQVLLKELNK